MANKRRNDLERLEDKLKALEQENRRLKRKSKADNKYEKTVEKKKSPSPKKQALCSACGKGEIVPTTFDLPNYYLYVFTCSVCGATERQRIKK